MFATTVLSSNCLIVPGTCTWSIEKFKPRGEPRVGSVINHILTLRPESVHSAPFVDEQEECEPMKVKLKYTIRVGFSDLRPQVVNII